ncbi:GTPase [Nostoc sp. CHAB 5836]|uniref:GTPase n=1 Tax=Nostoc sp. CHAB 5836 TaxID=2780404 RepID=UPI001E6017AD|nr:GTPase [Nostoc sp. CHAB 5836]
MVENYSLEQIVDKFLEELKKAKRELGQFNILIIGKIGVGKSTLINSVFDGKLADTGVGKSITQEIKQYTKKDCPITVYDTPGLELIQEKADKVKQDVKGIILEKREQGIKEHIHTVWYCVNDLGKRWEEPEKFWIQEMSKLDIPVILVLTQTYDPKESELLKFFKSQTKEELPVNCIIPILAQSIKINQFTIPTHGLKNLVEETVKLIPEQAEIAFIHQQVASINLQSIEAERYLIGYLTGSALIASAPLPTIEFGALLGLQLTMLAHISMIFGLKFDKEFSTILITAIAGTATTKDIGIQFLTSLLSWIPGANVAVAPVAAAIAATMTLALGQAYIEAIKWYKLASSQEEEIPLNRLADKIVEFYKKLTIKRK